MRGLQNGVVAETAGHALTKKALQAAELEAAWRSVIARLFGGAAVELEIKLHATRPNGSSLVATWTAGEWAGTLHLRRPLTLSSKQVGALIELAKSLDGDEHSAVDDDDDD